MRELYVELKVIIIQHFYCPAQSDINVIKVVQLLAIVARDILNVKDKLTTIFTCQTSELGKTIVNVSIL